MQGHTRLVLGPFELGHINLILGCPFFFFSTYTLPSTGGVNVNYSKNCLTQNKNKLWGNVKELLGNVWGQPRGHTPYCWNIDVFWEMRNHYFQLLSLPDSSGKLMGKPTTIQTAMVKPNGSQNNDMNERKQCRGKCQMGVLGRWMGVLGR